MKIADSNSRNSLA